MAPVLARYRPLRHIEPPGTLDGGDVMTLGRHVFTGESARTNRAGAEQLATQPGVENPRRGVASNIETSEVSKKFGNIGGLYP